MIDKVITASDLEIPGACLYPERGREFMDEYTDLSTIAEIVDFLWEAGHHVAAAKVKAKFWPEDE